MFTPSLPIKQQNIQQNTLKEQLNVIYDWPINRNECVINHYGSSTRGNHFVFQCHLWMSFVNLQELTPIFHINNKTWTSSKIWRTNHFYYYHYEMLLCVGSHSFWHLCSFQCTYSFNPLIGAWWNANGIRGSNFLLVLNKYR